MKGLVSIISPCYNGSSFVHRLLDSVLEQTYPFIEMYIIDDGSTDDTAIIVKSYISKFELKGYELNYIYQENSGQSTAVNKGLKLVKGEYLTWPDSDDFYATNDAIEKMALTLFESNSDVGVVRSSVNLLDETTLKKTGSLGGNTINKKEVNLFDDSVFIRNSFWFQPISYMVKFKYVTELIKDKEIFTKKEGGQNWQILLPIFYKYKCYLLAQKLSNVLVRSSSHSRENNNSFEGMNDKFIVHQEVLENTIKRMAFMPNDIKQAYLSKIDENYLRIKFEYAKRYAETSILQETYKKMKLKYPKMISNKDDFFYRISQIPFLLLIKNFFIKILKKFKWFFLLCLIISFLLNLLFIRVDIYPKVKEKFMNKTNQYLTPSIDHLSFKKIIIKGTKERLNSKYVVDNGLSTNVSFINNFKKLIFSKNISVYDYGEHAFLMWSALQVAVDQNDESFIDFIKTKFDDAFLDESTRKISRTDQAIYGCVAIELYKITKQNKYKIFSQNIFKLLDDLDKKYGLICYRISDQQQVDLLGIVCPFLSKYGEEFKNIRATELSLKLIENYTKYGVDDKTGIPSQGYNLITKTKTGYSNWGRGISWYLLALLSVDNNTLNEETCVKIKLLTNSLKKIISEKGFVTQFPGQSKAVDMSATLPIIYFLNEKSNRKIKESDLIKNITPYIHDNGLVAFNSPSISSGSLPDANLFHDMSQAMLLMLLFN